tara:strand:- start:2716 stop:3750 length:1035 start_codon:yes stop_codon:yes gene_type:complete
MLKRFIHLAEKGMLPDFIIRYGIQKLCKERLKQISRLTPGEIENLLMKWVSRMKESPIALVPEKANEQHYEVPPSFFKLVLGPNLKYSSGYWQNGSASLEKSELEMLALSCSRAELSDGQSILELGCGWGSLTVFMAKHYPESKITAVSNSQDQRNFIENKCKKEGLDNVKVITADMNSFIIDQKFDRVLSIEMFEHMRNYKELLSRIANFLNEKGKLFIHIFSHRYFSYPFENNGPGDWMAREFFSGGMMPSHNLLLYFQEHLIIESSWRFSGCHYEKTSLAWLNKMDNNKKNILKIFSNIYGFNEAKTWFYRWRIFFMSCEELFGYNKGNEWGVSHYLFRKP